MNGQYSIGEYVLGSWKLKRLLGEGSFGKVFEAEREEFGDTYYSAIKIITIPKSQSEVITARAEYGDEESVTEYFSTIAKDVLREFGLMSKFKGLSNIVTCEDHAIVEHENQIGWDIIIRMELLTPLESYIAEHLMDEESVIWLGIDMCRALELCRKDHVIHRDIKPQNIFVSKYGDFKLGDFGVARTFERTTSNMTVTGTINYMAPEVYHHQPYNASVDIYSLGIVMYSFLNNNRLPFLPNYPQKITYSEREQAISRRMGGETIPAPKNGSDELKQIVLKACAYDPKDRFSSPVEMRKALEHIADMGNIDLDDTIEDNGDTIEDNEKYYCLRCGKKMRKKGILCRKCKRRKRILLIAAAALIALLAGGVIFLINQNKAPEKPQIEVAEPTDEIPTGTLSSAQILEPASAIIANGQCGNNAEWKITEHGTLYISGNGDLDNYEYGDTVKDTQPWQDHYDDIKKVVIDYGITSIGDYVFSHCTALKDITIPDSVTGIGEAAFRQCWFLQNITIPNSVTSIDGGAFDDCCALKSVTLPNNITNISASVFRGCFGLTDITIPENVTDIGICAFSGCSALTSITIPNGVTSIGDYAFWDCRSLADITIPDSVTSIGVGAFQCCSSLKNVEYGGTKSQFGRINVSDEAWDYSLDAIHCSDGDYTIISGTATFEELDNAGLPLTSQALSSGEIYPKVSAGWVHSLYLGEPGGEVITTGSNEYRAYNLANWTDIVDIADGTLHALGLKADGTVVAAGYNDCGQCDVSYSNINSIIAIDAGKKHSVLLREDGTVTARGDNTCGQLNVENWKNIIAVSAGEAHTIGLKADGTVVAVGYGRDGECNVEDWSDIVAVSAGSNHTVGLKKDGTVITAGSNKYGQCNVFGWTDIIAVSAGERHTLGLRADGTVVACGSNEYGQCDVGSWRNIVSISAGSRHSLGGVYDGEVYTAGSNENNQLSILTGK